MLSLLKEILFPPLCVGCQKMYTFLCPSCYNKLSFTAAAFPLSISSEVELLVHPCFSYHSIAKSLIRTYKFSPVPDLSPLIAELLFQSSSFEWQQAQFITAVPLHPKRLAERGFNQSELVARELCKLTGARYLPLLTRTEHSAPQSSITDRTERLERMQNQFQLRDNWADQFTDITSSIVIIDDVFTTGATLKACATELLKNNCRKLSAVTIAHGT